MEQMKICKTCGVEKPLTLFVKSKQNPTGYRIICKQCRNLYQKESVDKKRQHYRDYHTNYRKIKGRSECINLHSRFKSLIKGAKIRKDFDISIDVHFLEQMWKNQNGLCVYTKLPLTIKANQFNTISIDRIDSSKNYTKENIQFVCRAVNEMKMHRDEGLFIHLCHLVAQNNKDKVNPVDLAITV